MKGSRMKPMQAQSVEEQVMQKLRQCTDCGSDDIGFSYDQDEHFCKKCGLVLD